MKSGAVGVMQMMPKTAREELGMNDIVTRAEDNIHSSAKYLRYLVEKYLNDPAIPEREAGVGGVQRRTGKPEEIPVKGATGWLRSKCLVRQRRVRRGGYIVGQETVQYIGNINKYYFVYS